MRAVLAFFPTLGKQSRNRTELADTYLHKRLIILLLPTFPLPTTSTLISLCNRTPEDKLLPLPAPVVVPVGAFTSKSSPCMLAGTCTYSCQPGLDVCNLAIKSSKSAVSSSDLSTSACSATRAVRWIAGQHSSLRC